MNLTERLRGIVPTGGSASRHPPYAGRDPAELLGGEWRESRGGRCLVIDTKYSPGHRHGRVAVADCLPSPDGIWPKLSLLEPSVVPGRLLFVDLETTGLAGGAGTYAFLVGCAWFEPPSPAASASQGPCFRIRQFLLTSHAAERALLDGVGEAADAASGVVTYNGKSFDLPLIETRFLYHRMETPFAGVPHVDMLHPARRLWRSDSEDGGRLATMEETLLGHVRDDDVPGFEIPARYFHYVRTLDARPLHAVLEHNRLDLLALAMLTARAAQLLEEGVAATRTAREAFGLGRLYERAGLLGEARGCYAKAADADGEDLRAEALRAYALLSRRERRHDEAATAWRRALELRRCPPHIAREATEALAVHLEHRNRDLSGARRYALQALQFNATIRRTQSVRYRLARLERKLEAQPGLLGS
jgi:uncharacterized protein YprB with RNaseH-like and TPR domain